MTESINNRSFTPLLSGRVYIGTFDTTTPYATATISLLSDTDCQITAYQSQNKVQSYTATYNSTGGVQFTQLLQITSPYVYFTVRNVTATNGTLLAFTVIYRTTQITPSGGISSNVNISDSTGNSIVSTAGKLQVADVTAENYLGQISDVLQLRGHATLWASPNVGVNGVSPSIDLSEKSVSLVTLFGNSSGITTLTVQFSDDDTTFYDSQYTYIMTAPGDWGFTVPVCPFYLRLKSSAGVAINAIANYC
jgi:hypothetical protein